MDRSTEAEHQAAVSAARREVVARPIAYPLGSGQAEEVALLRGLRPAIRQLLSEADLEAASARFARLGLMCLPVDRPLGPTRDGLTTLAGSGVERRFPLFVGRDRGHLEAACAAELAEDDHGHIALGRLLGYPRCCVEAFVAAPAPRRTRQVLARSLAATQGPLDPLLNVLDLDVFHFVSWFPCAFDCGYSRRYAAKVHATLSTRHAPFVRDIQRALAAHRLVITDDRQLSLRGTITGGTLTIHEAWPTARDRHPRAALPATDASAVAQALTCLGRNPTLAISDRSRVQWGREGQVEAVLYPFG